MMQNPTEKSNPVNGHSAPIAHPRKFRSQKRRPPDRTRIARIYPAGPFEEALKLADAIHKFAAGEKVRRLTLLQKMALSPSSSSTRMVITNSGRYGITTGSYASEWIELTPLGKTA